jgi:hypothetical protein
MSARDDGGSLRDIATWIALVGVLVTLLFNTAGVFLSVRQEKLQVREAARTAEYSRLSRIDAEFGMLTSVSALLNHTNVALTTLARKHRCPRDRLASPAEAREVLAAISNYDYLAWLFNQPEWTSGSAKGYWRHNMAVVAALGTTVFSPAGLKQRFPDLAEFSKSFSRRDWATAYEDCGAGTSP